MSNEQKTINAKANELLLNAYNLWTTINTDENGETYRTPGSDNEVERSRNILDEVDDLDITDVEVMQFIHQLINR